MKSTAPKILPWWRLIFIAAAICSLLTILVWNHQQSQWHLLIHEVALKRAWTIHGEVTLMVNYRRPLLFQTATRRCSGLFHNRTTTLIRPLGGNSIYYLSCDGQIVEKSFAPWQRQWRRWFGGAPPHPQAFQAYPTREDGGGVIPIPLTPPRPNISSVNLMI